MIIWLNGAFGSGKTKTSIELSKRIENSIIFDPEEAGFYIRDNLPKHLIPDDFQDIPLWRMFNYNMLKYAYENSDFDIIVPMTLTSEKYYDEIINQLRKDNVHVHHFTLQASREVLLNRLDSRGDNENSWAAKQIDRCLNAFSSKKYENQIQTDAMTIDRVVEHILYEIGEKDGY